MSTSVDEYGKIEMHFVVAGLSSVRRLLKSLKEAHIEARLKSVASIDSGIILTSRQERVLRMAMQNGYFLYPKKIKLKKLASVLGVSPSTTAEIVRRAVRKVVSKYASSSYPTKPTKAGT